jgi:hypothetical protein
MNDFFGSIRRDFDDAAQRSHEINDMMHAMYARFSAEQGTEQFVLAVLGAQVPEGGRPPRARVQPAFQHAVEHAEQGEVLAYQALFRDDDRLGVKHVYDVANHDVESWLRAVMSPLETQVREHHLQLRRRLESVKRIHSASGELEERIGELEQQDDALTLEIGVLMRTAEVVDGIVEQPDALPAAANG